jgi:hypothetical protein
MSRHAQPLAAAFAVRLFLVFFVLARCRPCPQQGDSINWLYGSLGIALGHPALSVSSSFWPPAFKLLAAAVFKLFGFAPAAVQGIETLLGLAGIALAYRLALRSFGASAAFVCALLVALLPIGALGSFRYSSP